MIQWIAKALIARNPALTPVHARRLVVAGLLVFSLLLATGGFALWLHFHDAGVAKRTQSARDLADLRANAAANETAGLSKSERDRADAAEHKELENDIDRADREGRSAADDAWNGGLFDKPAP